MHRTITATLLAAFGATTLAGALPAHAHEGDPTSAGAPTPNPATLAQLEEVRHATARFLDEQAAIDAGYVDISVFYPHMGHHYLNPALLDDRFEADKPELLVYVDDPCSGKRKLVAVEYAVPLALSDKAPAGFPGNADVWSVNQRFQLWTLHAWLFEYNPSGVLAAYNPRVD